MTEKIYLEKVEFYITNVCNLNCDNCNRLNNYKFSGHQYWKDHEDQYRIWSEKLNIPRISILGGEPLLNPDLKSWVVGIRSLWPESRIDLLTNGTRLFDVKNLYDLLLENRTTLEIHTHNRQRRQELINQLSTFLKAPINKNYRADLNRWPEVYDFIKDKSWPHCESYKDFDRLPIHIQEECINVHKMSPNQWLDNAGAVELVDSNGVKVVVEYSESFVTAPLKYAGANTFKVYNSDPKAAHKVCISNHCHHFIRGKLYKCHHVALLPEFLQQYYVDISNADLELLNSYQPILPTTDSVQMKHEILNLKNTIPQCKLCPSELDTFQLESTTDKPKVKKIKIVAKQ